MSHKKNYFLQIVIISLKVSMKTLVAFLFYIQFCFYFEVNNHQQSIGRTHKVNFDLIFKIFLKFLVIKTNMFAVTMIVVNNDTDAEMFLKFCKRKV